MYSFEGIVATNDTAMWSVHINVPHDLVTEIKSQGIQRLIATFNGKMPNHCALMSHGDGSYFILLNQERCKKLGLQIGNTLTVNLEEDKSKYGMPMPEEMAELLRQDPKADAYFHALTPGVQRSILFVIGKPKGSDTRLRKAITFCRYLNSVKGKFDFREYHQAMKDNRFTL